MQTVLNLTQAAQDYATVARAIQLLQTDFQQQPQLERIAAAVGLSESHFQRLFSRWVGISPKRFVQYLTVEHAKAALARSHTVLESTYAAGLSGPGRLHDLFVTCEAVTPGEYKARGSGLTIRYGFHPSPFGELLLGATERGICWLAFVEPKSRAEILAELRESWRSATFVEELQATAPLVTAIFEPLPADRQARAPLHLFVRGSNFQIKVWRALLQIPAGTVVTYEDVARHIGQPTAARAVGNAVAHNLVSYLIPCHRVLRRSGAVHGYRWGSTRKRALLGWEAAQIDAAPAGHLQESQSDRRHGPLEMTSQ